MAPHATTNERQPSERSSPPLQTTFKFPEFNEEQSRFHADDSAIIDDISRGPSPKPLPTGLPQGLHSSERWPARKQSQWQAWSNGSATPPVSRHGRQKSLSEAIKTVKGRKASVSENAHEIAASLRAPISLRLIVCSPSRFSILSLCSPLPNAKYYMLIFLLRCRCRYCALSGTRPRFSPTHPPRPS